MSLAGLSGLALAVMLAGIGVSARAAGVQLQPLPQNVPPYMRLTYPAAMSAPLPLPLAGSVGTLPVLPASQSYVNAQGQLGIYQTSGSVATSTNAFFQSLGTNGRSCFSCHQPSDGMSVSVGTIQRLFITTGGRDPIFAPVDGANCPSSVPSSLTLAGWLSGLLGGGKQSALDAHSLLLNKGLFRIFLPVPKQAEFTITVVSDPYGCNTDPTYATQKDMTTGQVQQMVSVYRRPRMSANLKYVTTPGLTLGQGIFPNVDAVTGIPVVNPATGLPIGGNIMADGREPTLESQARNATLGHAQALKAPTDAQVAQMVAYESSVFAAQSLNILAGSLTPGSGSTVFGGPQLVASASPAFGNFALYDAWPTTSLLSWLPTPATARASIARGQALFNTRLFSVKNVTGFTNASALFPAANPTVTTCSSCHGNTQAGNDPFSAGQRDIGTGGQAAAFGGPKPSPDLPIFQMTCAAGTPYYGTKVLTNDPGLAMITGRCADIGRKSVPQLRALAARAPYFSDGSAASLRDAVKFYNQRFGIGFTDTETTDLANFLNAL